MLPNFLIIGAPRSATTYLAKNLSSHPDVYIASGHEDYAAGDVHFFDTHTEDGKQNFARGVSWYKSLFNNVRNECCIGEKTADYLVDKEAAHLIYTTLGKIKLVVVLRDPVKRAWSHYNHSRHRLPIFLSFEKMVNNWNDYGLQLFKSGCYFASLKPYLKYHGKENIHIILQDELLNQPDVALKGVCEFLGIDSGFDFPFKDEVINQSSTTMVAQYTARIGRFIRLRLPLLYELLMSGTIKKLVGRIILVLRGKKTRIISPRQPQLLSTSAKATLKAYYRNDLIQLEELTGIPLREHWWNEKE